MSTQRGAALILALAVLGVGAVLLPVTLSYASTAMKHFGVSRESTEVRYDLSAVTQQALWELEYDTLFQDCDDPPDAVIDSFADCVGKWGSWTLATPGKLQGITNETQVDYVNNQEVSVSVEVPGALTAPPEPTPTPTTNHCLYTWVERDTDPTQPGNQTWAQTGEPITYTVHLWNCGDKNTNLRRVILLAPPEYSYVAGSTVHPNGATGNPEQTRCDFAAASPSVNHPTYCDTYSSAQQNTLVLGWPGIGYDTGDGSTNDNYSGSSTITLAAGTTKDLVFQATVSSWGVFYVDATVCFFSSTGGDPGPCTTGNLHNSGKVAPVVVGMFNINGNGKGHAFGASARLDGSGSDLISESPQ
ncbi:MAG: hypothetical protein HYX93_02765 [Chloroflexi bacterium]|nr:hypothetical protein [Chloroflexota bacterium]